MPETILGKAMHGASSHGMNFRLVPGEPSKAEIWCGVCGLPLGKGRLQWVHEYAKLPFGCGFCEIEGFNGCQPIGKIG